MNNQRQDKRWDCVVPVENGRQAEFDGAQSFDFSRKGMGFITKTALPLDKEIAVAIDLDESNMPVLVKGRVAWVQSIPSSGQYRVGLKFQESIDDAQNRLNEYFEE